MFANTMMLILCVPKCKNRDMHSKMHSQEYAFQIAQHGDFVPHLVEVVQNAQTKMCTPCRKPPRYVPCKGTYVPYNSTYGASDQG